MKVELHPCFILHQRPYRETSLILDVFSREEGRVPLVAKGVRNKKSKTRSLMQIYQKLLISWSSRGEMGTLTDIETLGDINHIYGKCLFTAFYMNELLTRLLHSHVPYPDLFDHYEEAISNISDKNEENVLRMFEKRMIDSLGYGLILDHDVVSGDEIHEGKQYYYKFDQGPTLVKPEQGNYLEISGKALISLRQNNLRGQETLKEAKRLLQPVIRQHIGPKPLKSRELYKAYLDTVRE